MFDELRPTTLEGVWYSGNADILLDEIVSIDKDIPFINGSGSRIGIVPHAGYSFSLRTACHTFKAIKAYQPEKLILLGFSHFSLLEPSNKVHMTEFKSLKTPLGNISCYEEQSLSPFIVPLKRNIDLREHCLEIQFPLLKYYFPNSLICPLMIPHDMSMATTSLVKVLSNLPLNIAIIATTDLNHWGSRFGMIRDLEEYPKREFFYQKIQEWDHKAMEIISELNVKKFKKFIKEEGSTICGGETTLPIIMEVLSNLKLKLKWIHYHQSNMILHYNTKESSVSYGAGISY